MVHSSTDEQGRLAALHSYGILDTPPETDFDLLTRLVARICDAPIATVTLVDEHRQWFKAVVGLDLAETDRAIAFCHHAIRSPALFVVPDARLDPRFASNPLVIGEPGLRFYAGMPLVSSTGFGLGTLAVMDRAPRTLTDAQTESLMTLGKQVMVLLELRLQRRLSERTARDNAQRYLHLSKAGADALWDWNLETDSICWNEGIHTSFGVPPEDMGPDGAAWIGRIHPEERDRVRQRIFDLIGGQDESWTDEYRFRRQDGSYAHVLDRGFVIRDGEGRPVRMVGGMTDQTERKRSELERDRLHQEKAQLLEATGEGIWQLDSAGRCTFANGAAARMLGYEVHELLGHDLHELIHYGHADRSPYPAGQCPIVQAARTGRSCHIEEDLFWRKDRTSFPVKYVCCPIIDGGKIIGSAVMFSDLTEAQQAKLEIMRINRALQMRSACNELLIRASDETGLLTKVCRLAMDIGGYRMAWAGYAEDDAASSIKPVAHAGDGAADFVGAMTLSWSEHLPAGRGPEGGTIRNGVPTVLKDLGQGTARAASLAAARRHGYRSLICLPLRSDERTFGLLALYSGEVRPIAAEEIKLLQALADDLAFGIGNLRAQDERRRLQSVVSKVAAGVSASGGTLFFEQLARHMAEAVGAHVAFIARLRQDQPFVPSPVVAVVDGTVRHDFDLVIEALPCEHLLLDQRYLVHAGGDARAPGCAALLAAFGAQACVGVRLDNADGQPVGLLFVCLRERLQRPESITSTLRIFAARVAAELERQEADTRIRNQASLLDKAQDAIIVCGIDHHVQFWNKSAERLYRWTSEEAMGHAIDALLHDDPCGFARANSRVLETGEWTGEITQRRKDGSVFLVEARWTLMKDAHGQPQSILAIHTDITQRKAAECEIRRLAFNDPLTRLPNRQLLLDRLQHALAVCSRTRATGALLFIDLDNFKTLNETLGHQKGDQLLQQVALRLSVCVRTSDTVARLGGDEFVVMLEDLGQDAAEAGAYARAVGEKILTGLNLPYQLTDHGHYSSPSMGVALFGEQDADVGELLKHAELAMYQAKAAGRNTLRFFDPEMQTAVTLRAALESDLRDGLQNNEFVLHFQPQVNRAGHPTGAEALVRWLHPRRGLVSPAEFIPLAEDTGLILPLGQWVLESACTQLAAWAARPETAHLTMAVNVSARQFRHAGFIGQVLGVLERTGADPRRLKLELTEGSLIDNIEETIGTMIALKAKGVAFSLDDFGTGYSSLAYLKRLPLDQLKIDQSFVRDVLSDANDATIARTIVTLGQSLGLAVIAEGVESEAQRDFLIRHNCDAFQGYLFSRPLPADQFDAFMQALACAA